MPLRRSMFAGEVIQSEHDVQAMYHRKNRGGDGNDGYGTTTTLTILLDNMRSADLWNWARRDTVPLRHHDHENEGMDAEQEGDKYTMRYVHSTINMCGSQAPEAVMITTAVYRIQAHSVYASPDFHSDQQYCPRTCHIDVSRHHV